MEKPELQPQVAAAQTVDETPNISNEVDNYQQPTVVGWDEDDPNNPTNWSFARKVSTLCIVSAMGFTTPFAADAFAPAIPSIMSDFNNDNQALRGFVVSIFVLGNAVGPVAFAPASELWGRVWILNICNVLFIVATVACALATTLPMLFLFRFIAGCAGAAPLAVGGGTIADMVSREQRGRYFGVFAIGAQLAPVIGPVIGGFLSQSETLGWRWIFWVVAIIHGVITAAALVFLKETYSPALLESKCRQLRREQPTKRFIAKGAKEESAGETFRRASVRPAKLLFKSPIVLFLAIFQACVYGYRYLIYTIVPLVFGQQYGFSIAAIGLTYLGTAVGASIALYAVTKACDELVIRHKRRHDGAQPRAEIRLLPMVWGSPLTTIGFLWYGWAAQERAHWMLPIVGTGVLGAGITAASLPSNVYMVDAFPEFAASGLAASFFLRSVVGGFLPLAGTPLYVSLGVGWASSLLGFIALFLCIFPPLIYKYGEQLRQKFPVEL